MWKLAEVRFGKKKHGFQLLLQAGKLSQHLTLTGRLCSIECRHIPFILVHGKLNLGISRSDFDWVVGAYYIFL